MISLIFPTYNEDDNLSILHKRLVSVVEPIKDTDFEFIFIDDCSGQETRKILEGMAETDPRVKIIRFARNCGSHAAVTAGINLCRGDAAIVLAADLQDPPEIIPSLIERWQEGFEVVWGVRKKRENESFYVRAFSRAFYFLMNRLTDIQQPATGADVFLIDRAVIEAFKKSRERNASVYMLIAWFGFRHAEIMYIKEKRHAGLSKWTVSKRLKLFFDSLVSFSYVPLRFMSLMGGILGLIGLLYGIVVLINGLRGLPIEGWSSLMIVVLLLGGFQVSMLGLLGEYLWRTYDEARGRPRYIIERNTLVEETSTPQDTENTE